MFMRKYLRKVIESGRFNKRKWIKKQAKKIRGMY